MALTQCKECKHEVASTARKCPNCGVKNPGLKAKNAFLSIIFIVGLISILYTCTSDTPPEKAEVGEASQAPKWYEGGDLHTQNALAWQNATEQNRLASSANIVFIMKKENMLKSSIANNLNTVDDLKPYANELKSALDAAFMKADTEEENIRMFTNQNVSETALLITSMMGWR